jgi:NADH-quinone oxidoreductase subunit M
MHASVENLVAQISTCKLPTPEAGTCLLARPAPVASVTP